MPSHPPGEAQVRLKAQSHRGPGWAQARSGGCGGAHWTAALSGDSWIRTHLGSGAGTASLALWVGISFPHAGPVSEDNQALLQSQKAACGGWSLHRLLAPPATEAGSLPRAPSGHPDGAAPSHGHPEPGQQGRTGWMFLLPFEKELCRFPCGLPAPLNVREASLSLRESRSGAG